MSEKNFLDYLKNPFIIVVGLIGSLLTIFEAVNNQTLLVTVLYGLVTVLFIISLASFSIYRELKLFRVKNIKLSGLLNEKNEEIKKLNEKFDHQSSSYSKNINENNRFKTLIRAILSLVTSYGSTSKDSEKLAHIIKTTIEDAKKGSE